eukprot:g38412.t1
MGKGTGETGIIATATQSEESNPDDVKFDVPQNKLNNEEVLEKWDRAVSYVSQERRTELKGMLQHYEDICENRMGKTNAIVYEVDVGNAVLIKQHPYRLKLLKAAHVQKEVKTMVQEDIIKMNQSEWSSPIVLVPKPDGTQRFCLDYLKVNTVTKSDSYPIPRLEDCVEKVGQATYITKLDLLRGYWQVPLLERTKEVSAFVTPNGLHQFKVTPFGMKNESAIFQRFMNRVVAGLTNCASYIDNLVIFSHSWKAHMVHLAELFEGQWKSKLVTNLAKTEFVKTIFASSPATGEIPEDWRVTNVPLFKKGNSDNSGNYRLEVTKVINEDGAVDVVYVDFNKAFDKVPHGRLIQKIKTHGIH